MVRLGRLGLGTRNQPSWPYQVNLASPQAQGLVFWLTMDANLGWGVAANAEVTGWHGAPIPLSLTGAFQSAYSRTYVEGYNAYNTTGDVGYTVRGAELGLDIEDPFTFAARVYRGTLANETYLSLGTSGSPYLRIGDRATGYTRFYSSDASTSVYGELTTAHPTDRWYWIVGCWNGVSWRKGYMVDGGRMPTVTDTQTKTGAVGAMTAMTIQGVNCGVMDIRLYNRLLHDQEIAALSNQWKDLYWAPQRLIYVDLGAAPATDLPANTPPANANFPFDPNGGHGYVWHCHIVDHEDNEMMRPDEVTPNPNATRTYVKGVDY